MSSYSLHMLHVSSVKPFTQIDLAEKPTLEIGNTSIDNKTTPLMYVCGHGNSNACTCVNNVSILTIDMMFEYLSIK